MSILKKVNDKNFDGIPFRLTIPEVHQRAGKIVMNTAIKFSSSNVEGIILTDVIFEHRPKTIKENFNIYIGKKADDFPIELAVDKTSISFALSNSTINLHFIASNHEGYSIIYKLDKQAKCLLLKTTIEKLDSEDENVFRHAKSSMLTNKFGAGFRLGKISIELYKKKVLQEMYYLKEKGGRKLKVNNGIFISLADGTYSYSFDLESELFVSEDSPVTLKLTGKDVDGTVLMCEGFQLTVLLKEYVGNYINSAHLTVAPWKLLRALHNRLDALNKENEIAMKLLDIDITKERKAISDIPMGQDNAINNSINNPISIIWGPPGTGKTYTMAQIAMRFLLQGKTLLMVSHSNISVDGLITELYNQIRISKDNKLHALVEQGKILRYGFVHSEKLSKNQKVVSFNIALNDDAILKKRREKLLDEKEKLDNDITPRVVEIEKELKEIKGIIKTKEKEYVSSSQLIATTISKVSIDKVFDDRLFDVVMFDEASMAYVPQIIEAAMFAKSHFICVGDFRQLAPIAQSEAKEVLSKDIFMHLGIVDELGDLHYHPWLTMLNEQRRMHPDISAFSSLKIYEKLLLDHFEVKEKRASIANKPPFKNNAMILIDLTGTYSVCKRNSDNSRFNVLSALLSFQIALDAVSAGQEKVGIITPYQAQSRLIQALINDYDTALKTKLVCSTVHQFQGSECDVIIFDAVESHPYNKPGILMSKNENDSLLRLINVAITRAKGKFITLANTRYWDNRFEGTSHTYHLLLDYMRSENLVIDSSGGMLADVFTRKRSKKNIRCYLNNDYLSQLIKDLDDAEQRIIVSIPKVRLDEDMIKVVTRKLFEADKYGVSVIIKTNDYKNIPKDLKRLTWVSEEMDLMPLLLIDDKVIWYGSILSNGIMADHTHNYLTKLQISYRVIGKKTIELIKSLSDIEFYTSEGIEKALIEKKNAISSMVSNKKTLEGLPLFVYKDKKCRVCGEPMKLRFSQKGKPYMKCSACDEQTYLDYKLINEYIKGNGIRCPQDDGKITAGVGIYGLYIRCEHGHFVNLKDII